MLIRCEAHAEMIRSWQMDTRPLKRARSCEVACLGERCISASIGPMKLAMKFQKTELYVYPM